MNSEREVMSVRLKSDYVKLMDMIAEFYEKYMTCPIKRGELVEWMLIDGAENISNWLCDLTSGAYTLKTEKGKNRVFNQDAVKLANDIYSLTNVLSDQAEPE